MTATFGFQGAHAEIADEIDALLDDVHSAGLNGVDRVNGASLTVEVVKTRGCRLRHMLAAVAGSGRTSLRRCRKSDGTDEFCGGSQRHWKGRRSREAWPSIESGGVKENDGGGWQLFFRILETLGERKYLLRRAMRAARAAFHSHTRSQHAMWSSPCSRARFNRACVRRALASLSTTVVLFLQHGGVNPAGRPLSLMAWSRALRAADSASRISPLSFDGDKRGRMRQFYEAVAFDQKFLWSDASLRLLAHPRAAPYMGPNLPLGAKTSSACPVDADRTSMPRKVAVVLFEECLPPGLVGAWNHPECEAPGIPVAPRYFYVNMAEWRALFG